MVTLVILDLDGTLISERAYILGGFRAVAGYLETRCGIQRPYEKLVELFETEWSRVFNRLFEQENMDVTEAEITKLVDLYRRAEPKVSIYPDAVPFCKRIKKEGIHSLIVTNGYASVQRRKLEQSGLAEQVDQAIIPDQYGRDYWKPDVRLIEQAMKRWGVHGTQTVFIGDGDADFLAARALGVRMLRIRRDDCVGGYSYCGQAEEIGGLEEGLRIIEENVR